MSAQPTQQSGPPPDWLIRRDIVKAAHGAPFAEHTTVYAPPLEWSSEMTTIHGAAIRVVLHGDQQHGPPGWVMRLDYVDAPIRVYVHWLFYLGCEPSWFLYSYGWGDVSTPNSSLEVGAWKDLGAAKDDAMIRFPAIPTNGLTHSVRDFDVLTATIARVIDDGYTYDALCAALEGIAA